MTGKAPSSRLRKEKPRSARPYDRPNQGILGKVASRVKGLFTPSWLFNVSGWVRTNEEEQNVSTTQENVVEPDLTENEEELDVQPVQFSHGGKVKKQRLECSGSESTEPSSPFWLAPSTSRENVSQNIDRASASVIQDCDRVGKEPSVVVNGMLLNHGDDHSENSDNSASTSGCSSLVSSQDKPHRSSGLKLSESALELLRGELKCNLAFQKQRKEVATITSNTFFNSPRNTSQGNVSLWSCGSQTPGKSPQVPSLLNSSRPSFSVSSFGGPSNTNSPGNKIASPFYEGNTTFGGASAYRKRQMTNTPYQMNPSRSIRCQVKVASSNKEFECMSSAAKRILHTLETMSTPITDAKKIPNVDKSPLFISPPSHRFKSYLSPARSSPIPTSKGPPVVNLSTVSKLTLLKNHRSKVKNSMMELPLHEQPMVPLPPECSASSSEEKQLSSGGGKMRTKLREPLHASLKSKLSEEVTPEYDLPNVPLPISSVPTFKFTDKSNFESSSAGEARMEEEESESQNVNENLMPFKFSTPIHYSIPNNGSQKAAKEPSLPINHQLLNPSFGDSVFKFSSPLTVQAETADVRKLEKANKSEIYKDRSINEILKSVCDSKSSSPIVKPSLPEEDVQTAPVEEELVSEKNKTDSNDGWPVSCSSCFGLNKATCSKCCSTTKTSSNTAGFGDKFKPKAGSWMCTVCLVQNTDNFEKCVACETQKPSTSSASGTSFMSSSKFQVQVKPGSWECSTCLIRNDSDATQCAACETKRPTLKRDSTSSPEVASKKKNTCGEFPVTNKLTQDTSGTWECDICMVRNPLDKDSCVACETLRPSKEKTATTGSTGSFKFGLSSAPFKFGSFDLTTASTSTTTTISFGASFSAGAKSSASPVIFGSTSLTSMPISNCAVTTCGGSIMSTSSGNEKPLTEGFKFSVPVVTSNTSEDKAKAPVSSSLGGFQFGVPTTTSAASSDGGFKIPKSVSISTSSEVGGFQFSKPIEAVSSSSDGFQLAKTTSTVSEGFKLPGSTFGSTTFGGGFKFGEALATKDTKTSSVFEGLANKQPLLSTPSLSSFVTDQSGDVHSKTDSKKSGTLGLNKSEAITTLSSVPMFSFPASSAPAPIIPTLSTVASTPTFGSVVAQSTIATSDCKKPDNLQGSMLTNAASTAASLPFTFNPSKSIFAPSATSGTPDKKILSQEQIPRTQTNTVPVFSFGSTAATTSSIFSFGVPTTSSADTKKGITSEPLPAYQKNPSLFSFGTSAKSDEKPVQGGFSFKPSDDKPSFTNQNQVGFGAFKTEPANAPLSSTPVFKFGSSATPSTGGFVFGATSKTDSAPSSNAQFTFGAAQSKPNFGGFQATPLTATTIPSFSFGTNLASSSATSAFNPTGTTAFSFNGKSQPSPLNPTSAPSVSFRNPTGPSMFGAPASTTSPFGNSVQLGNQPAFGSSGGVPVFPKIDFNFPPQSSNLFAFGSQAQGKKAMPPAQGVGFNFMPTQVDANTNFTQNFNINNPPSFNFSATPTNQPFQFAASSDVNSPASGGTRKIRKALRRGIRKD